MSRTEAELQQLLSAATALDPGVAQCSQLEDIVRHADAGSYHELALTARRSLANAYSVRGQWDRAFPLLARCLSEFVSHPEVFGPGDGYSLRSWYCWVIQSMPEFHEVARQQIADALDDVERRYRAAGQNLRDVYEVRRQVAQFMCDWVTEEHFYRLWKAEGVRPSYVWDFEVEISRLLERGDPESISRAAELAAPVVTGDRVFDEPPVPIQCHMLVPLARGGKRDEALLAYRRSKRAMADGVYRIEYFGMQAEFLALTGNLDDAIKAVGSRICLSRTLARPNGVLWFHVAAAVVGRELVAAGRGDEVLDLSCGHASETITATALYATRRDAALGLARRFDARNGNSGIGDAVRRRLEAARLPNLPLDPLPRPIRAIPDPATLTPERNLQLADYHHSNLEWKLAKRFLTAAVGLPAELEPQRLQLAAEFANERDFHTEMQAAVAAYVAIGDEDRAQYCRLRQLEEMLPNGNEQAVLDYVEMHLPAERVVTLRARTELIYGRALGYFDRADEKTAALVRARELADGTDDAILRYHIAHQEYYWARHQGFELAIRLAAARRKLAAAMATGSLKRVALAVTDVFDTHAAAGTLAEFDAEIAALLESAVGDVRAGLEFGRASRLVAAGRESDAVAPLSAVVAAERPSTPVDRWHMLARCHAAAGATTAAIAAADMANVDGLDASSSERHRTIALECRAIVAEGYVALGDWEQALPHLAKLAARDDVDAGRRAHVLSMYGDALAKLDRYGDAAEQYRAAQLASASTADARRTARCATEYVRCVLLDDRYEDAVAAMSAAEEAVRAFAPIPDAPQEWRTWAQWHRVGAQVLAAGRRGPEAVGLLGHAATEFRHCADELAALEMDALAGRILLGEARADLAEPILRSALDRAAATMPSAPITGVIGGLCIAALHDLGRPHDAATLRDWLTRAPFV